MNSGDLWRDRGRERREGGRGEKEGGVITRGVIGWVDGQHF